MKKIYYEKRGRRYFPVAEYDRDYMDSLPKGNTLIMSYPGGVSRRYNVDANYAAMIAAGRVAETAICNSLSNAAKLKPAHTPITEEQRAAWVAFEKAMGQSISTLNGLCIADVAQAAVDTMQKEADKLMSNPAVRASYEKFQIVCDLTKDPQSQSD